MNNQQVFSLSIFWFYINNSCISFVKENLVNKPIACSKLPRSDCKIARSFMTQVSVCLSFFYLLSI
uniref:Secreted protein n=1 Tax=Brugia timori TaxID=42155 RepID=A0A0R3QRL4_9BILA